MRTRWMLMVLLLPALLGCSRLHTLRVQSESETAVPSSLAEAQKELAAEPAVVQVTIPRSALSIEVPANPLLEKTVRVSFADAPLRVVLQVVGRETGCNVMLSAAPEGMLMQKVSLEYNGALGGLLQVLSEHTGSFVQVVRSTLVAQEKRTFTVLVPNYPGLFDAINQNLSRIGAQDIGYDEFTSRLTFAADYPAFTRIEEYLKDLRQNMALVTLRIMLLDVRLEGGRNAGIDWSSLGMVFRHNGRTASTSGSGDVSSSESTDSTDSAAEVLTSGVQTVFGSTGANLLVESSKFTLSGLLNFIEKYGRTSVLQNVFTQTLSGKKARLESLTETPYVKQVSVASLSDSSSATQNTAETEVAKSGVDMEFTPTYSREQGTVTLSLNVGVYGVSRFVTLSAGNLGSFTQPETTKKTVATVLRMAPHQVAIIGGLLFDRNDQQASGLPGDSYATKAYHGSTSRQELVVLVRPQVYEFVPEGK